MNYLFIVSLFFLSVSGLPLLKKNVLVDQTSLISEDPDFVAQLLQMIEDLRSDNTISLNQATDARDSAQAENDAKSAAFDDASDAEVLALGNLKEGERKLVDFQTAAKSASAVEADARTKMDDAQSASDKAADFLASEGLRLDDEKATLEEVGALIEELLAASELDLQVSTNRNLLSIVDMTSLAEADPVKVAEVKSLINDLIAAGESEREAAVLADDRATEELASATSVHDVAWNALAVALGTVDLQTHRNVAMGIVADDAVELKKASSAAFDFAAQVLSNALEHFASEDTRVKDEEAVFVEVSELLSSLS